MFGRRKRASSQPARNPNQGPPKATAASTAAAQAFLANRASHGNLSSAAAAAALRSLTSSPTPVGDIQTKRMARRGSHSSNTSAPGGAVLRRQNSSGSMTERTFRDPSPGRGTTDAYGNVAPPMPAFPKAYGTNAPTTRRPARPMSTEPPTRVSSPPPQLPGGRGVSLDRGPGMMAPRMKRPPRTPAQPQQNDAYFEQDQRRSSVNFSRPMSPQSSPPVSPRIQNANGEAQRKSNANTAANIAVLSSAERHNIEHEVNEAASAPVRKKKKKPAAQMTEGSHLMNGSGGAKPAGTAVDAATSSPASDTAIDSPPRRNKKVATRVTDDYDSEASEQSDVSDRRQTHAVRGKGALTKQPSIVREDREAEEEEERGKTTTASFSKSAQNGTATSLAAKTSISRDTPKSNSGSKIIPKTDTFSTGQLSEPESQQVKRDSLSPARQAHFSAQPILETPLARKHQPPARSVSPAKSALKQSPSPRGPSPSGATQSWNKSGHTPSEVSDEASLASDEGYRTRRRKSVRVSFDDDPVIVGHAAQPESPTSPVLSSPQDKSNVKRGWFAFGKDKPKSQPQSVPEERDDVMQPIPVLPSFGSIRGPKKVQETSEKSKHPSGEGESFHALSTHGPSDDRALGDILVRNQQSRQQRADPSEPLPPEVTTVEGSGYHSDTESSIAEQDDFATDNAIQAETSAASRNFAPLSSEALASKPETSEEADTLAIPNGNDTIRAPSVEIPQIAVQPATPGRESIERGDRDSWLGMPGGFPKSDVSSTDAGLDFDPVIKDAVIEFKPSDVGISEPEPEEAAVQNDPGMPSVGHVAESIRQQTAITEDDEESDSGNSIYSDAAEDQSDLEGDGYGSINAIVESPMPSEKKKKQAQPPPPSPPPRSKARPQADTDPTSSTEPSPDEGWGKAQTYWSGLSTSRKAELEQAAQTPSPAARDAPRELALDGSSKPNGSTKAAKQSNVENGGPVSVPVPKKKRQPSKPINEPVAEIVTKSAAKKPSLKKSMRDGSPAMSTSEEKPVTQLRSSMRDGGPKGFASGSVRHAPSNSITSTPAYKSNVSNGMPVPETRGALQKKHRPMSSGVAVGQSTAAPGGAIRNRPASMAGNSSSSAQGKTAVNTKPAMRRQISNGSDSDSSFTRARQNRSQNNGGRYSMRSSMRAGSVGERPRSSFNPDATPRDSKAFSVRSMSPAGNSRRPGGMNTMRTSLRATSQGPEIPKSPTRSLFGRKAKATPAPVPPPPAKRATAKPASRFKSRFNDSSDEDDGPANFSSRFADSSDEDEPAPLKLTPVRGIPRRTDEGESTELEDSDEEKKSKQVATKPQPAPLTINTRNGEGAVLASGSLRRSGSGREAMSPTREEKKRRSFFGTLGRRKDKNNKIGKVDFESAARRDTGLERTQAERNALKNVEEETPTDSTAALESLTASPKSPKLQRRNPQRVTSDSWPLPPPVPQSPAALVRPNTSDGTNKAARPQMGGRGFSAVSATTGKKKRFPMLRKAFGLHD